VRCPEQGGAVAAAARNLLPLVLVGGGGEGECASWCLAVDLD
jgi:hypothetical protein